MVIKMGKRMATGGKMGVTEKLVLLLRGGRGGGGGSNEINYRLQKK